MPKFSHDPPELGDHQKFELRRTPCNGRLQGIVTSTRLIGCPTHFWRGRTVPCEDPKCPACEEGCPWRWHGFLAIWDPKTGAHYILELTAPPAETVGKYYAAHGTIRGALILAQRNSTRPNARVLLKMKPAEIQNLKLPTAPDLTAVLCHIWNVAIARTVKSNRTIPHQRLNVANEAPLNTEQPTAQNGEKAQMT